MEIRNTNQLIYYLKTKLKTAYSTSPCNVNEVHRLEHALDEINEALEDRDIHRLLECRNKYAPKGEKS